MAREITSIHVMVHPLFISSHTKLMLPGRKHPLDEDNLRAMQKKMPAGRSLFGILAETQLVLLKKHYLNQIKKIRKTPGALLFLVTMKPKSFADKRPFLMMKGLSEQEARLVHDTYLKSLDDVQKSASKLGRKAVITYVEPKAVGATLFSELASRGITPENQPKIEVFGEWLRYCVKEAHKSIVNAGFRAKKKPGKSIPH